MPRPNRVAPRDELYAVRRRAERRSINWAPVRKPNLPALLATWRANRDARRRAAEQLDRNPDQLQDESRVGGWTAAAKRALVKAVLDDAGGFSLCVVRVAPHREATLGACRHQFDRLARALTTRDTTP